TGNRRGARARPAFTSKSCRHDGGAAPHASPAYGRTTSAAGFLAHGSNGFARPSQRMTPVAAGRESSPFTVAGTAAASTAFPFNSGRAPPARTIGAAAGICKSVREWRDQGGATLIRYRVRLLDPSRHLLEVELRIQD